MVLQRGEREEPCSCHDVDTVGGSAQADEWGIHFPFGGGIEEGELFSFFDITPGNHDQPFGIENYIGITGVVEGGELANLGMLLLRDLDRVAIGFIEELLGWNFTDDLTLGVGLFCDQTSKFIFRLDDKRIH